jgi:hypothetical protein
VFGRLAKEESGIALVTAVVVSLVILMLVTVVLQLSVHNVERSADDRRRVQAIDSAEAGIDYYYSYLTDTQGQAINCNITKPMRGSPGSFTVHAFFYDTNGVPLSPACPPGASFKEGYVMLYSEGKSGPAAPLRRMQSYAKLTVSKGATFDNSSAIFAQNSVNFTSNARIGGDQYSDADIYSNGDFVLASNSTIYGRIFSQGAVTLKSNSEIKKDVHAKGTVTMLTRAIVRGSVTSSQGSISLAGPSRIYGNAKARGTITGGVVDGTRSPNQSGLPDPPTRSYPTFTYVQSKWTDAGYTIAPTFSGASACTDAATYMSNVANWPPSGGLVIRIAAPGTTCIFSGTTNVYRNLAIISDGAIELSTNARFVPNPSNAVFNVFVFAGLSGTAPCNFTARPNSGFNPGLVTLLYTPSTCTIDLLSNSSIAQGQMIGGTINFKHTAALNFQPVTVPGEAIGGFKQDVAYKREIRGL